MPLARNLEDLALGIPKRVEGFGGMLQRDRILPEPPMVGLDPREACRG